MLTNPWGLNLLCEHCSPSGTVGMRALGTHGFALQPEGSESAKAEGRGVTAH